MKILFISRLFHNVSGGVERMAVAMMNEMIARGHDVELMSWDRSGAVIYYPLDTRVAWHKLDIGNANERSSWRVRAQRQMAIRKILKGVRPDVMIGFQNGPFFAAAVAGLGLSIPGISAERNAPHRYDHTQAGRWRNVIFQSFRLAECITVQLDDYVGAYPEYLRSRIVSIPNPVYPAAAHAHPQGEAGKGKVLLSVGRLSYQKNQPVLIEAFAKVADRFPDWKLQIVGSGEAEKDLRQLVTELALEQRVELIGAVKDVEQYYLTSHLFCLPSRWEGFPNALAEAMAHGLPAVGYADCAGVGQLIKHDQTGKLAPGMGSPQTLAESLSTLMADDSARSQMGKAAIKAMGPYTPKVIFDRWETLFRSVAGKT